MEWCNDDSELAKMKCYDITLIHKLFNRDGYYYDRHKKFSWFELNGRAYHNEYLTGNFCYKLNTGREEYILPDSEATAMRTVLHTTRDRSVKKVLQARLCKHNDAVELRNTRRRADISCIKFDKEHFE